MASGALGDLRLGVEQLEGQPEVDEVLLKAAIVLLIVSSGG